MLGGPEMLPWVDSIMRIAVAAVSKLLDVVGGDRAAETYRISLC
jgi:hypothetical protein